jgi:Protein of unknown function (DUF4232)
VRRFSRLGLFVALAAAAFAVFAPLSSARPKTMSLCTGGMLTGTFKVIPNSPGAGNIVYRLRLKNSSRATCGVTGLPALTLLDAAGRKLPTHARFSGTPGTLSAVLVTLKPGATATLTARFSPDVPGPGEPVSGRACERTAYKLRVAPSGGGSAVVPISPATPVCEHGGLQITVFTRG